MQLLSPVRNISRGQMLRFRYYIQATNDSERSFSLQVYHYSTLMAPVAKLLELRNELNKSDWQDASVCLPSGSYRLVFEATMGMNETVCMAIDSIRLLSNANACDDSVHNLTRDISSKCVSFLVELSQ